MEIEIIRCTTNTFIVPITVTNGEPYAPRPGDVVVFGVEKRSTKELQFIKTAPVEDDGSARITIKPEDTESMHCDNYFYEVGLKTGEDYYNLIPMHPFVIKDNITDRGCALG